MPERAERRALSTRFAIRGAWLILFLGVFTGLGLLGRQVLQYKAEYAGGLTFVGSAEGLLGVRYYRTFLWRPPQEAPPLPPLAVDCGGKVLTLSEATEANFAALGGQTPEGALWDTRGNVLQYRFEAGNLNWFSVFPAAAGGGGPDGAHREFRFRYADGPWFTLPVDKATLFASAGVPREVHRGIAN